MVFDPDNYNFRLDAGSLYSVNFNINGGGAGTNAIVQLVNPAGSGVNARLLTVYNANNNGGIGLGFDTAALGGAAVAVTALKSGAAAGKITATQKATAATPATYTQALLLSQIFVGNIAMDPSYGVQMPLLEITPGNQADIVQVVQNTTLINSVVWVEVPTGAV